MKKTLLTLLLCVTPWSTFAAEGNSTWGNITDLYYGSGGTYVQVTLNVFDSVKFCGQANKPYILEYDGSSELTRDFYKTRVAALMAAYHAQTPVRFYLDLNDCNAGRPRIKGLQTKQ